VSWKGRRNWRPDTSPPWFVHQKPKSPPATQALAPGIRALTWQDFVAEL